jgi:hypothetical protein
MKSSRRCAIAALALLSGCSTLQTEQHVDAYLPITRMELPETGSRRLDSGVGTIGAARLRLTTDQRVRAPDPARPEIAEAIGPLGRFDASPVPMLTVGIRLLATGLGGHAKVMPLQPMLRDTPFSFAVTTNYAEGYQSFDYDRTADNPGAHTHVRQRLVDGAAIVGVRVAPDWLLFGGPYRSRANFGGDYKRSDLNNNAVSYFAGEATARGGNLGFAWTFVHFGRLVAEVSRANVHTQGGEDVVWLPAVAVALSFGPRFVPVVPPLEEPVRVVPVNP